jgi:dihydrofolate reductase
MSTDRRVVAAITLTLDGHTTGPGGPYDMSCIAPHGVSDEARAALMEMTRAPIALLGRKNYEGFSSYWPHVADDPDADSRDRAFARWLNSVEKMVFSTTLEATSWSNAHLSDAGPVEAVRRIRAEGEGDIRVLSSQSIIRQLLDADEIDRLEITLAPEIVAGGDRLFQDTNPPSRWALSTAVATGSGAARLVYDRDR